MRWAPDKKGDYILQLNNNAGLEEVIKELDNPTEMWMPQILTINVTNQLTEVLINGAKNCGMVTQPNPFSNQNTRKNTSNGLTRNAYLKRKREFEVARRRWRDYKNVVSKRE